jgi:alpha-L-rhamnosidase
MEKRMWSRRWTIASCAIIALTAGSVPALAQADRAVLAVSRTPIAPSQAWREAVLNRPGDYALPKAASVDGDAGAVIDPAAILSKGGGALTLTAKDGRGARVIVDMGQLVSGYVELGVVKASGAPIRVAYSEAREYLGKIGDASDDPEDFFYNGRTLGTDDDPDGRVDVFAPPPGTATLTSAGLRGSQRYIAISLDGPGSVTLDFIRVRQTNFQGRYDGHFLSSDERLNRAWYGSAYSVDLSTIRDLRKSPKAPWVIIDGPKRDRIAYAQDLWVVTMSGYNQSADYREVVRDTINLFACQQYPDGSLPAASLAYVPCEIGNPGPADGPPEGFGPPGEVAMARLDGFSIWWVICLADYVRFTGDRDFAKPLLPVARRILEFTAKHAPDGVLFKTDNYDGKYGFSWHTPDKSTGIDSSINVAYFAALQGLARLERTIAGDEAAAGLLEARAARVKAAVVEKLWDPAIGAMILNSEDPKRDHSADANAIPLLFDILDKPQATSAMAFLQKRLGTPFGTANSEYSDNPYMSQYISPYIMALETIGRMRNGDAQGSLDLIRKAWTHMIESAGTPWEEVGLDGRPNIPRAGTSLIGGDHVDLAHAWSTAVPALSMYVLGVRPLEDGYRQWVVAPEPADLAWAQGDVPVPGGAVSVRWKREKGFALTVAAPTGTTGKVSVPLLGGARTIAMDGRIVWRGGRAMGNARARLDGDRVVFEGIAGRRTFAWVE